MTQKQEVKAIADIQDEDMASSTQLRKDKFGAFAYSAVGKESFVNIESDLLKLKFSNKGGRIYRAEVKNFQTNERVK